MSDFFFVELTKPTTGKKFLVNPRGIFAVDQVEMMPAEQTLVFPIGGGDPFVASETPTDIETMGIEVRRIAK